MIFFLKEYSPPGSQKTRENKMMNQFHGIFIFSENFCKMEFLLFACPYQKNYIKCKDKNGHTSWHDHYAAGQYKKKFLS